MHDYISRKIDINGKIDAVTVKQFDNNSRYLHVTLSDADLPDDDSKAFDLTNCTAALYIQPSGDRNPDKVAFVDGEIADEYNGIVTFLLPSGVTQNVGTYDCEIWIYQGDETNRPIISTKPFTLTVEKSIRNSEAIQATSQFTALDMRLITIQSMRNEMDAVSAMANAGEIPAGTVESEVAAARGNYGSLGAAMAAQAELSVKGAGFYLNSTRWTDFSNSFDHLPNNIVAPCGINNSSAAISGAPPLAQLTGTVMTFGRNANRTSGDTQVFIPWHGGTMFYRQYNAVSTQQNQSLEWSDWVTGNEALETAVAALPQHRGGVNASHASYSNLLSHYTEDGTFLADSGNWNDIPAKDTAHSAYNDSYIVTNAQYSGNYILQTAVGIAKGAVYNRIICKTDNTVFRDWFCVNLDAPPMNILAVGDSICSGFRNGGKGFVGDLGMPFVNEGIAETTLSNVVDGTVNGKDRTCIPGQLARIRTRFPDYSPDIIIADGGINDYTHNAAMGAIPTAPVTDANGLNALDASTVMGGLQRLFYYMITLFPEAQRFFLITHKTFAEFRGEFRYLPQYQNTAGYTQQDLHDAIVQCCNVYNVKVIDVYRDSMLNTAFPQYRSDVAYANDNTKTETEYVDLDGVHPMALGYREAYLPLIRQAISGIKGV